MVSFHFHSSSIHTITHPIFFYPNNPHNPSHSHSQFKLRTRRTIFSVNPPDRNTSLSSSSRDQWQQQQQQPRTLFPGGFKRPEIKVPTLLLQLNPGQVLEDKTVLDVIDAAVSKTVGIVLLNGGEASGGKLYEAACLLKSVIRDRAYLMIAERVDIAAAVGACGVVLSDQGLPTIVARDMMMGSKSDSVTLPLVARNVEDANRAVDASTFEGADFLIYGPDGMSEELVNSVSHRVKIPTFVMIDTPKDDQLFDKASKLMKSGSSGLVISVEDLKVLGHDIFGKLFYTAHALDERTQESIQSFDKVGILNSENGFPTSKAVAGFVKLEEREKLFIENERLVLLEAISSIQRAAPMMEEVSLLVDAVTQLDEPFLLVIVGEFNSGKSTFINALLGKKYVKDGVVPTTNEITFLRYSELDSDEQQRCERNPDGQYTCYLPAPILKGITIVDTPGTNVILQRQQRLTEEFVPRADLLLFVISADRPLTESEVAFLRYTQQWKKKVVFVLNKADIYQNAAELEEATTFIKENTKKLLNSEHITLYPVSARFALEAKLSPMNNSQLKTGSFYELEKFLYSFLDASTSTGIERMKLKLETPIRIAEQLLFSCQKTVRKELQQGKQDLESVTELISSVQDYAEKMESGSISWKRQALAQIDSARARVVKLVESTLQLSNLDLVTSYVFNSEKSGSMPPASTIRNNILVPALSEAQKQLGEYVTWLQSNNARERRFYKESFEKRWPSFVHQPNQLETGDLLARKYQLSIEVIEDFSAPAASKLFEQEIREVFLGTFGGLGVAGLSASLLTSVLPSTLEDLLALGLCSTGGLLAISNFPVRRQRVVDKVKRTADALALKLEDAMQKDLLETTESMQKYVKLMGKPYQDLAQERLDKLLATEEELTNVAEKLNALQIQIQNLHIS